MPEVPEAASQDDVIAASEEVVAHGGGLMVKSMMLDLATAEAILRVAEDLEHDRRERLAAMDLRQAAAICRKLVGV